MDTEPEERFDRICRVASKLLNTPIAYVSLLDQERQFFKSAVGLGDLKETTRADSFCTFTIEGEASLYIPDATKDNRFQENPYVVGAPGVRCYLGEPLFSPDGFAVGTFCILDLEPRELDPEARETFRDLAQLAERELNLLSQLHQQRKLTELTSHLVSSLEPSEITEALLTTLQETVNVDRAAVAVRQGQELRVVFAEGAEPTKSAYPIGNPPHSCFPEPAPHKLSLPILYNERVLGALWLEREGTVPFSETEKELVSSFVFQTGLILENREILANLFEQSRLVSLGSLAAGVAHEINSPLGAAKLSIDSALRSVSQDNARLTKKLQRVNKALDRAGEIIKSVLQYAGDGPDLSSTCELSSAVSKALELLSHDLRQAGVEVRTELECEAEVPISQGELQDAVHNLLSNAFWATTLQPEERGVIEVKAKAGESSVTLAVSDNGPGIEEALRKRIFDPFFTTREPGEGVGLGLSVSRRIVESAGGSLILLSGKSGATTFELSLPLR